MEKEITNSIADILTSSNGFWIFLASVIFILLLLVLSKFGFFSFKGNKLKIGKEQEVRTLLLKELEYIENFIESSRCLMVQSFKQKGYECDEVITVLIFEKVLDLWIKTCCVNNINKSENYITTKTLETKNVFIKEISRYAPDLFRQTELINKIYEEIPIHTKKLIEDLVNIKETEQ